MRHPGGKLKPRDSAASKSGRESCAVPLNFQEECQRSARCNEAVKRNWPLRVPAEKRTGGRVMESGEKSSEAFSMPMVTGVLPPSATAPAEEISPDCIRGGQPVRAK